MTDFPFPRVLDFVAKVTPFDTLDLEELARVVRQMKVAFYPRGKAILRMGQEPPDYLYIVHVGSARVTLKDEKGEELLVDIRGEGDTFGALSLLQGRSALFDVVADEDIIAFLLHATMFRALVDNHPQFSRHFSFSMAHNFKSMRLSTRSSSARFTKTNIVSLEMSLIGRTVGEIMVNDVLTCAPETSLQQTARLMKKREVSSMVVVNEGKGPVGIITDTDLRNKVLATGHDVEAPVSHLMSADLKVISPHEYAYDAMLMMIRSGVSHLLVTEGQTLVGIISVHDLQKATGGAPVGIVGDIVKSRSVDDLVRLNREIYRILESLLRQGGPAKKLVGLVAELNDRLTRQMLKITIHEMADSALGPPPAPFSWLAMGSEGRREQTLTTDQDNALSFADAPPSENDEVQKWFLNFGERIVEGLVRCGYPRCSGNMMACNPDWCHPQSEWRRKVLSWIEHPFDKTLLLASMFFDFRSLYAAPGFEPELRELVNKAVKEKRGMFLRYSAKSALYNRPPLGFLRQFVVEKSGERKNKLDLKKKGLQPVVDLARVMAMDLGLQTTNTFERLEEITRQGYLKEDISADLVEAYSFIMLLRISQHVEARTADQEPDNYVDPQLLNSLQRKMLKESFAAVNRAQDEMAARYATDDLKDI